MAEISPALYRAGSGEPLLLLHGFTGTWHHWRALLGDLVGRYEVIAPTLAGHVGGPEFPADISLTFDTAADSLERHLDELGVETAHVVGNSMGGGLALELAKRGRARSVVALAPAGGWTEGDGEAQKVARFFARQLRVTRIVAPRIPRIMSRASSRRLALRDIMRRGELVAPADAVDLALTSLACEVSNRVIAALRVDKGLALSNLDRITCPVLLALSEFDRVLPADRHGPRLRREIPGVETRTMTGCGHLPMWDDTRLVVRTISGFVDRHAASAKSNGSEASTVADGSAPPAPLPLIPGAPAADLTAPPL